MLSTLFSSKPLLDETSVQWLFDSYAWALRNFDASLFRDHTVLVQPNDRFFPGRVDSVEGMAGLIEAKVKGYAGIAHWPTHLLDGRRQQQEVPSRLLLEGPLRTLDGSEPAGVEASQRLPILYDPALINNPEALIASFAHTFAHYLSTMAKEAPPGGEENWAHVTEVVATFTGFGLLMANSAYSAPATGCGGSCGGGGPARQSFLSQYDMTYSLAIFCVLKGIPNSEVLPHLKSSLRGFYKKAAKAVARREELAGLRALMEK